MKTALKQWITAGIVAGLAALAGPAWAQLNSWQCGGGTPPNPCPTTSPYIEWNNFQNWSLGQTLGPLGVPGTNQVVQVLQSGLGSTTVNYTENSPVLPNAVFGLLWIDGGMTFNHTGTDTLRTAGLAMGNGAAYNFGSTSVQGVRVYGTAIIGASGGTAGVPTKFAHTGQGVVTVDTDLILGQAVASYGKYEMGPGLGTTGALNVTGSTIVGQAGTGIFVQQSGTHTAGKVVLGEQSSGSATYYLQGGKLVGKTIVGDKGWGSFGNQGAAHNDAASARDLILANQAGSTGFYTMTLLGPATPVTNTATAVVGYVGTGTFNHFAGAHNSGELVIGGWYTGVGTYTIASGASLKVSGNLGIGTYYDEFAGSTPTFAGGTGTFTQQGGAVEITGGLYMNGVQVSLGTINRLNSSTYKLQGGELKSGIFGSMSNNSTFEHTAGTHQNTLDFIIGASGGSAYNTIYHMTSVGSIANFNKLEVGYFGRGILNQENGTVNVAGLLTVGAGAVALTNSPTGTYGVYNLAGGALNAYNNMIIGRGNDNAAFPGAGGKGTVNQYNGSASVTGNLTIGQAGPYGGGTGKYEMWNGSLKVTQDIVVGGTGSGGTGSTFPATGEFLQHGGTVAALGLTIGNGIYTMDGTGVLSAERVDVRADGRLNLYGGQITLGTLPSNPGTLTVELGGFVHVDGTLPNSTPIKFYGGVNNFGTISLNSANITWNDVFLNGNAYINDPSTSIFNNDLVVTTNGYIKAGVGDIFEIRRNFLNSSTNAAMWDTDLATLFFGGAGRHEFGIDGIDRGANGFGDNFGWDDIILDAGAQLVFYDSNPASAKPALYVRVFSFSGNLDANSFLLPGGTSLTIYYDQTAPENQPLINALAGLQLPAGLTFTGYGSTQGAPEPGTLALLGLGLAGLVASRRRKH